MLNKNNLTFTVKGFTVVYHWTQASNMETTVNKKCENYIKQTFKFSIIVNL